MAAHEPLSPPHNPQHGPGLHGMTAILQCPVCRERLDQTASGYACTRNHSFDTARQGYVNLLLAHKKHSKEPGDGPDMIRSRRRFLDCGFYDALSDGINAAIMQNLAKPSNGRGLAVLDAGCGEGFYLKRLHEALVQRSNHASAADYYGADISKFAVRAATQRDKAMHWLVASINDLPFLPSSLDVVLNVFSPANFLEFSRILRTSGILVLVGPGPRHLKGLREIIYSVAEDHAPPEWTAQGKGLFASCSESRVTYPLKLAHDDIMDLLAMTPYYWNIDRNTKSRVEALDGLELDVDVIIGVMKKI